MTRRSRFLLPLLGALIFCCASPGRADLIAHYTFDAGEPFDDEGGNDGIIEGNVSAAGVGSGVDGTGQSMQFGGAGHIEVPIDVNPLVLPELTVTMWVKADGSIANSPGLYKTFGHDDGGWDRCFGLDNRNGEYRWAAFTGTGPTPTSTGTPVTEAWTFIACVWGDFDEGGNPVVRFHAGESFVVEPFVETASSFTAAAIGGLRPDNFNESFRGRIDDVRIYDSILDPDEIDAIRDEVDIPDQGPPEVTTTSPGNVRPGTGTLRGRVNPNGAATTAWFEYGPTTDYGSRTADVDLGSDFAGIPLIEVLDGLDEFQVVHYRVVAQNSEGTVEGQDQSFVAPSATQPLIHYTFDAGDATDDTGNGFDGIIEGDTFAAGPGTGVDGESDAMDFPGAGHIVVPLDVNPGVFPDLTVTMWVRAGEFIPDAAGLYKTFGHDDGGWDRTFGLDNREGEYRWAAFSGGFNPGPTPTTGTPVTNEWTFLAAVWSTAEDGTARVRFHADANLVEQEINNTPSAHTTCAIGNLRPDNFAEAWQGQIDEVRFYGAALSVRDVELIRGEFVELDPDVPEIETVLPTGIRPGAATLRARVVPNGLPTTVRFEYGLTDEYGETTPDIDIGDGFANVPVESAIAGLDLDSNYHFRVVASNDRGRVEGPDQVFHVPNEEFLLLHYTFDDDEPEDVSGNENHGTVEGDSLPTEPGFDDDGAAFDFFGAGHIVAPVDINPGVLPDATVTMWVRVDPFAAAIPALYKTFGHDDGGWDRGFGLDNRNGEFRWAAFNGNGITAETGTPVTEEWTFLAAVWNGSQEAPTVRFHADENFVEEALVNTNSSFSTCAIGSLRPDNFNEGWRGQIDEVRIYGRALTPEEIDAVRTGEPPPPVGERFVRGDADGSGAVNITDGIFVLNFLFLGGPGPACLDGADADDSSALNITDGIYILNFLFLGGPAPAAPYPGCGVDPTDEDRLSCDASHGGCVI